MSPALTSPPMPTQPAASVRELRSPRVLEATWVDAHAAACDSGEPVFVPVAPYADDRGWSLMNLFSRAMGDTGQVNFSTQYPGVVKAWHRHERQTDFWVCLTGHLKIGVYREEDGVAWTLVSGERRPGGLIIPPGLWHGGAVVGSAPAGLLYYVTHAYDPAQPDEERRAWDSVDGFPWESVNR